MTVPATTRLVIARHGETEGNRAGVHQGRTDSPLTAEGFRQAQRLGEQLVSRYPNTAAIYSSPVGRARATAAEAGKRLALAVTLDDDLVEGSLGEWEGLSSQEIGALGFWAGAKAHPDFAAPGGESFRACGKRAAGAFVNLAEAHRGATVVVVTHQGPICQGLATLLGTALPGFEYGLDNGGFSEVTFAGSGARRTDAWRERPVNR